MPQLQDFMQHASLIEDILVMSQFKLSLKELEMELLLANANIINTTKMTRIIISSYNSTRLY